MKKLTAVSLLPIRGGEGGSRPDEGAKVCEGNQNKEMPPLKIPLTLALFPPWIAEEIGAI